MLHDTIHSFNWPQVPQGSARPVDIKVEPQALTLNGFTLLSPPSSPAQPATSAAETTSTTLGVCRRQSTSLNTVRRAKPYPSSSPQSRVRFDDETAMSNNPNYAWSSNKAGSGRNTYPQGPSHPSASRRMSDPPQQQVPTFTGIDPYATVSNFLNGYKKPRS